MNKSPFTIDGAFQEGWRLTKKHLWFFIFYQIILYIATLLSTHPEGGNFKLTPWFFIGWIIVVLGKIGLYNSTLWITAGLRPGFDQFYRNWRKFIPWVVANFLFGVMFVIGLILLIFPGCYILSKYGFFPFFILDKNSGPIDAFKESANITEGIRLPVFLLFISCFGLNILGFLFFGIGLLLTIPISLLALATVYRQLTTVIANDSNSQINFEK